MEPNIIHKSGPRQSGRTEFLVDAIVVQLTDQGNEPSNMLCLAPTLKEAQHILWRVLSKLTGYPEPAVFGSSQHKIAYGYNIIEFRQAEPLIIHGVQLKYVFIDDINRTSQEFRGWVDNSLRPFAVIIQTSEEEKQNNILDIEM